MDHALLTCEKICDRGERMTTYFTVEAMVRGYHIYKEIWESSVGEQLICEIEETNRYDSHAVAVVKSRTVVLTTRSFFLNSSTTLLAAIIYTEGTTEDVGPFGLGKLALLK